MKREQNVLTLPLLLLQNVFTRAPVLFNNVKLLISTITKRLYPWFEACVAPSIRGVVIQNRTPNRDFDVILKTLNQALLQRCFPIAIGKGH